MGAYHASVYMIINSLRYDVTELFCSQFCFEDKSTPIIYGGWIIILHSTKIEIYGKLNLA